MAQKELKSIKFPGLPDTYAAPESEGLAFNGGYQDDDGYIHLTRDGAELDFTAFTPFRIAGGGGETGITDILATEDGVRVLYADGTTKDMAISGGGSGAGGTNNAVLRVKNTTGWLTAAVALGSACALSLTWSSLEDGLATGAGTLEVYVNDTRRRQSTVAQGAVSVDAGPWLTAGDNAVRLVLTDSYGNAKQVNFTVKAVEASLSSSFDDSAVYSGTVVFPYTPVGEAEKTLHLFIDTMEVTKETSVSGRQVTVELPALTHGEHRLRMYFEAELDGGQTVRSNELSYHFIYAAEGETAPALSCDIDEAALAQYETVSIGYMAYTPGSLESEVRIYANGALISTQTVDRTKHSFTYRAETAGEVTIRFETGEISREATFTVVAMSIPVEAETDALALYLSPVGRSNSEADPTKWTYGGIEGTLTGFSFASDGWQTDDAGAAVLRVSGSARVNIPYPVFGTDCRATGRTVEVDFAVRSAAADEAVASCMSGGRGFELTPRQARLVSEQTEISAPYREQERIRVSFVVEKRTENRLILVYLNGVLSGAVRYPAADNFSQTAPVGITIGSNQCVTDIYGIRVYESSLTREQVLGNWIADTASVPELLTRWEHNDVFDAYGSIVISKLPPSLPYLVVEAEELPRFKGDKKTVSGRYVDPADGTRSFSFEGCELDVQGTSSQFYPRKNYKARFKGGFSRGGETAPAYALRDGAVPTDTFTFKADMASSEGANNVELARLYNDVCPARSAPQRENAAVRQGIDGLPVVLFWRHGDKTEFIGKYNFNNDKGTPEVFGFGDGDESWEIKNNTSERVIFKSADYAGDAWREDFEARWPEDNADAENLAAFAAWVMSTDGDAEKFKDELADWCMVDSALFYYLFTELFLMVDSRAKNAFPTRYGADGKWMWLPYDFDTALGINNEGRLAFGYELEDVDHLTSGANVFNGQDSVFWCNIRDAYADELEAMYKRLRTGGALSYERVEALFKAHQAAWPEAVFNEDAWFKYIAPLAEDGADYLYMCQGSKAEQRRWWLYNRFRYMDAKYHTGDAVTDYISFRGYAAGDITVTPAEHTYAAVQYAQTLMRARALTGQAHIFRCPLDNVNDTEIAIYSASRLADVGDLAPLKIGSADFSKAVRLRRIKVGDKAEDYENGNLTSLAVGNNTLLETLDARNCTALTGSINLGGCTSLREVYLAGTRVTGVTLPNGGVLETLQLPATVTNLTVRNQPYIETFEMPSYANITTLRLENVSRAVDAYAILSAMSKGSRVSLKNIDWTFDTPNEVRLLLARLAEMKGIDDSGGNVETAVVTGVLRVGGAVTRATVDDIAAMATAWPGLTVTGDITSATAQYIEGTLREYRGSVSTLAEYAFYNLGALKVFDTDAACDIGANAFNGCAALNTVVLRDESISTAAASAFTGTLIPEGVAGVFVPANRISGYKTASDWSAYRDIIYGTGELMGVYGRALSDAWDEIAAAAADGSCYARYRIGDTKELTLGDSVVTMQLAAVDTDTDAGGAKAPMTWLVKGLGLLSPFSSSDNYSWSSMRGSFDETLGAMLPQSLRESIRAVSKVTGSTSMSYKSSGTSRYDYGSLTQSTTVDRLWPPSLYEAGATGYSTDRLASNTTSGRWNMYAETSGVRYKRVFKTAAMTSAEASRIRATADDGTARYWDTRTGGVVHTSGASIFTRALHVTPSGAVETGGSGSTYGNRTRYCVFGFCL